VSGAGFAVPLLVAAGGLVVWQLVGLAHDLFVDRAERAAGVGVWDRDDEEVTP
jgi:hypothetical protein